MKTYTFWNGKNLDGSQEYLEVGREPECASCGFRCVEGGETTSAQDL
jgi:hypothetical protein